MRFTSTTCGAAASWDAEGIEVGIDAIKLSLNWLEAEAEGKK